MAMEKLKETVNQLLSSQPEKLRKGQDDRTGLTSQVVDLILEHAINENASDIHIEPEEGRTRIRFRIDGRLYEVLSLDDVLKVPVITRVEIMSGLQTDAMMKRKSQDGRFTMQFGGNQYDFRVATFPTVRGEKMAIRILNENVGLFDIERIGLDSFDTLRIDKILQHKYGLILVSGPTGSGKTTTLYAILNRINSPRLNIVTLEDPVEYKVTGMNQCDIRTRSDFQFADGLRAVLRQDPDIILVGEIRDRETADIGIRAAMTGRLVFSSIHSNNAIGTIVRMINMGLEPYMVSYAMVAAIAQRLVRKICPQCKVSYPLKPEILEHMKKEYGYTPDKFLGAKAIPGDPHAPVKPVDLAKTPVLYKGEGCSHCNGTGYRGRIGVFEIVLFTEELRDAILRRASAAELQRIAEKNGTKTLAVDGLSKVREGITTLEEVYSVWLEA